MIPKYYFGMSEDVLMLALLYSLFITYRNYKVYLDIVDLCGTGSVGGAQNEDGRHTE